MTWVRTFTTILAVSTIGFTACKSKDDGDAKTENSTKSGAADTKAVAPKPTDTKPVDTKPVDTKPVDTKLVDKPSNAVSKIKIDEEVLAEIKAIASNCEVTPKDAQIKCANKEDDKLFNEYFGYGKLKKDRVSTIGAIATALADPDPKVKTIAAKVLRSKFSSGWGAGVEVGQVDKEVAELLRATFPELAKLGEYQPRHAIGATVYASSLSGTDAEVHTLLEGQEDKYVVQEGWSKSMFYGRMNAFEKVKGLAATGDAEKILSAVGAANNMYKYTEEEKALLCPWAYGLIAADAKDVKESDVFEKVGGILLKCQGGWIDKLLDFGEAQRKVNVFDRKYYFVFRNLCFTMMPGSKNAASDDQCERNFKFLEKTANTKGIDPQFRAWALDSISYQRRDEKSLKLMKKYKNNKIPEIKEVARKAITMLEGYVKKKK